MTMFSVRPSLFLHPFNILYFFLSFLLTVCRQTLWTHQRLEHWVAAMLMSCCSALVFVFTEAVLAAELLQLLEFVFDSYSYMFWCDFPFSPFEWMRSQRGKKREGGRENESKEKVKERNCPSPDVCILFMPVTYSADRDIKKWCHDVHMTVYRLFSGLFLSQ